MNPGRLGRISSRKVGERESGIPESCPWVVLSRFADELEEAVLLFGREGRLLWANRMALHLFGEGVKPGASPIEASLNYAFSEAVEEALAGKRVEREILLLPAERWVKVVALPGEEVWVVARDVTPERRLFEMRDRFLAQAAHELRTPVGAIAGWAETLEELSPEEVGEQRELLSHIRREAQRLGRLVEDLLQLSRLRGREVALLRRECDLGRLAREAVERFRKRFEEKGVELFLESPSPVYASLDADRVARALDNLLDNGLKFTPPGGRVTVKVGEEEKDLVVLEVEDTGEGMTREEAELAFEPFYRGRRPGAGAGLGLAVVKEVVEAHRGRITVRSSPGAGSAFRLEFPRWSPI